MRVCVKVKYQNYLKPIVQCYMNLVGTLLIITLITLTFVGVLAKFQFHCTLFLTVDIIKTSGVTQVPKTTAVPN